MGHSVCYYWSVCAVVSCFSHVQLFLTPWTVALQDPMSMGFSRQEYWSGLPFPSPGDLPNPGTEPVLSMSPALTGVFFNTSTIIIGLSLINSTKSHWTTCLASLLWPRKIFPITIIDLIWNDISSFYQGLHHTFANTRNKHLIKQAIWKKSVINKNLSQELPLGVA